jgi:16S rRNA (guanine(966)-N(2))-methyltransferase RsmD
MPIRIIGGTARGRKLKLVPGEGTRPVMDRVKEALFNILGDSVIDSAFLDLFAGTGSVGIEALSRGAARAVFVENSRLALRTIEANLELTRLGDNAEIVRADVIEFVSATPKTAFDFAYIAPPQYRGLWKETLTRLDANPVLLNPDAVVVVQIDPQEKVPVTLETLVAYDERRYGNTLLWFFERSGE